MELSGGQIKSMLSRWFVEAQGTVNVRESPSLAHVLLFSALCRHICN